MDSLPHINEVCFNKVIRKKEPTKKKYPFGLLGFVIVLLRDFIKVYNI